MISCPKKIARPRVAPIVLLSIMAISANQTPAQQAVAQTAQTTQKRLAIAMQVVTHAINPWDGNEQSDVATTVGHAEGTRGLDGTKTRAYYGHVDPGNGVWNLGSFSYQHCDSSCTPEEADRRQLKRLRSQGATLYEMALARGITPNLAIYLNALDLANQAPLAALDRGGFMDRLKEAQGKGLKGEAAILWARTYAFVDPRTNWIDAPGLGGFDNVSYDQDRRMKAIKSAYTYRGRKGGESVVK